MQQGVAESQHPPEECSFLAMSCLPSFQGTGLRDVMPHGFCPTPWSGQKETIPVSTSGALRGMSRHSVIPKP